MKTLNYVIMRAEQAYINEVNGMIVNTTIEDVSSINRIGTVVSAPEGTILQEGDELIVHHNIMRLRNDTKGFQIESDWWIKDDLYFVPLTEIFMYRRDGSDWIALDPFCFVEPIPYKHDDTSIFKISKDEVSYKGMVKNKGILRYPNPSLLEQGLKAGDTIVFSDYSEYEFNLDGKLYYKMATRDILMKE